MMSTEKHCISGSQILLEKIAPYQQCKEFIRQAEAGYEASSHSEGNELIGSVRTYPLLALARGVHCAIGAVSQSHSTISTGDAVTTPEERKVAEALSGPFHSIHQNMAAVPSSGKKLWWLEAEDESTEEVAGIEGAGDQKGFLHRAAPQARLENRFLDAAVSLPVFTEVLFPHMMGRPPLASSETLTAEKEDPTGQPLRRKRSRGKVEEEEMDTDDGLLFGSTTLSRSAPLCRYGKALLARVHAEIQARGWTEYQSVLDAIRTPAQATSNPQEGEGGAVDPHRQDVNALVRYIQTSASSSSSSSTSRSLTASTRHGGSGDVVAIHAYLKRCMWIADQSRASRSSGARWDEMSESERVKMEMAHTAQQRARFSRTRSK